MFPGAATKFQQAPTSSKSNGGLDFRHYPYPANYARQYLEKHQGGDGSRRPRGGCRRAGGSGCAYAFPDRWGRDCCAHFAVGATPDIDKYPENLKLGSQELVLQLLVNTSAAIKHNNQINLSRWRWCAASIGLLLSGTAILFAIL